MAHVLFVCTGNYYRSRFAEAVFNHWVGATADGQSGPSGYHAISRGLATHLADGDLSIYTEAAMAERGIARNCTAQTRQPLTETDLAAAEVTIALSAAEHRPMMLRRFPAWADRIRYWEVEDLPFPSDRALPAIEQAVRKLLNELGINVVGK